MVLQLPAGEAARLQISECKALQKTGCVQGLCFCVLLKRKDKVAVVGNAAREGIEKGAH